MEMQVNILSFASILAAAEPFLRQGLVFSGGLLLLTFPVLVFRARPFAIGVVEYWKGSLTALVVLILCGGLSGVLICSELVRSYAFSPLWYCLLPAISAASVFFQYAGGKRSGMIRVLSHGDSDVRYRAAMALWKLGGKRGVDPLIDALSDVSDPVRRVAARALGHLDDKRAVNPLMKALSDRDSCVRYSAAASLGRLGDKRAIDPLIEVLSDDNFYVRRYAARALEQLDEQIWAQCIRGTKGDFVQLALSKAPKAVVPLINALSSNDADARETAAHALGLLGDKQAVGPLIETLSDINTNVRRKTAEVLGRLGDTRAVDPLIKALSHSHSGVREAAAKALGQLGDKRTVDPLIAALSDKYRKVRAAAAEALGRLGDGRGVDPLIEALSKRDDDSAVLWSAAKALGRLGDKRAVDPLIGTLSDDNCWVREAAVKALVQLGDVTVAPLIEALSHRHVSAAATALGRLGNVAVKPLIKALSADDYYDVRKASAEALGQLGDKRAVGPLIDALSDDDYDLRKAAAETLGRLGDKRAVGPLVKLIEVLSDKYYWEVRDTAEAALKKLGKYEPARPSISLPRRPEERSPARDSRPIRVGAGID